MNNLSGVAKQPGKRQETTSKKHAKNHFSQARKRGYGKTPG
jgi:hypothetical protein